MSFTKVAPAGIGTEPGSEIKIGDSLLHSTGIDLGSGTGIGASITRQGNATFTGIVTAVSFSGSGANLTGVASTDNIKTSTTANFTGGIQVGGATTLTGALTGTTATFTGDVGIGGTLTYEDVTNIDSVGIGTFREGIFLPDNKKAEFGNAAGSGDLQIFHDGSNSIIKDNGTGAIRVLGGNTAFMNAAENKTSATFNTATSVDLRFNNSIKFQTTNTGAVVTGILTATQVKTLNGTASLNKHSVGIGTTDTAGRNAGVGTAVGTLVYNSQDEQVQVYTASNQWVKLFEETFEATGGSKTTSGDKTVHTFTSPGTFTVSSGSRDNLEYLVVAGGGGGGGAGGGAGGFRTGTGFSVATGAYPVTVGGGGNGGSGNPVGPGNTGSNSVFSTITSAGGGSGGGAGGSGGNGGSGGGGGQDAGSAGAGNTPPTSPPQGNNGGVTQRNGYGGGGGGGGAGQQGFNATSVTPVIARGGQGGSGTANSISGSSVTYAGGGGGGCNTNTSNAPGPGVGGAGGGGTGAYQNNTSGSNGTVNTGGGGGGAEYGGPGGGQGGSGIVILSYPTS